MLTKEEYKKLSADWAKHSVVYQKYERYTTRFPTLKKHLDVLAGKDVLEVGANAGLAAYEIVKTARSYVGVERATGYWQQSLETQKQMENKSVQFLNMSVKSFVKRHKAGVLTMPVNACYLSYVLYHFEDKEVEMFKDYVLPMLDVIVVQSRFAKRNIKGRTKHNRYGFWHPDNVEKYLKSAGFKTTLEWGPDKKFHFIIGTKEHLEGIVNREGDILKVKPVINDKIRAQIKKEMKDADTGEGGVHTESESPSAEGQSTREREGRPVEREPQRSAGREAAPEGPSGPVLEEERGNGGEGVLQPSVGESAKAEVREENIPKVVKAPRTWNSTKARKDSVGKNRSGVQGEKAQG